MSPCGCWLGCFYTDKGSAVKISLRKVQTQDHLQYDITTACLLNLRGLSLLVNVFVFSHCMRWLMLRGQVQNPFFDPISWHTVHWSRSETIKAALCIKTQMYTKFLLWVSLLACSGGSGRLRGISDYKSCNFGRYTWFDPLRRQNVSVQFCRKRAGFPISSIKHALGSDLLSPLWSLLDQVQRMILLSLLIFSVK